MRKSFSLCFVLILAACSNPDTVPEKNPGEKPVDRKSSLQTEKDSIAVFNWDSELCTHESKFNARLYTKKELKGTLELLNMVGSSLLSEINSTAFKPTQIQDLDNTEELDALYRKKKKALQELPIVNDPFWKGIKNAILQEMKDEYDLTRIGMKAYTNPAVLKGNRFSSVCPDIVTALNSKDTSLLMKAWRTLVVEQSKSNGSPEYVMKQFEEESNDPDRLMYARVELITFGWHNKVNRTLPNIVHDEKLNNKFEQLFLETHAECDEP